MTQAATISAGNAVMRMAKDFITFMVEQLTCQNLTAHSAKRFGAYSWVRENLKNAVFCAARSSIFSIVSRLGIVLWAAVRRKDCKETVQICDTCYLVATILCVNAVRRSYRALAEVRGGEAC